MTPAEELSQGIRDLMSLVDFDEKVPATTTTKTLYTILKQLVDLVGPGEPDPQHCQGCEVEAKVRQLLNKYKEFDRYQIMEPLGGK